MKGYKRLKQVGMIALILVLILQLLPPLAVGAHEAEQKVVRVGWYESTTEVWFLTLSELFPRTIDVI